VHAYAEADHGDAADYLLRQVAVTAGQQRRIRRTVEHVEIRKVESGIGADNSDTAEGRCRESTRAMYALDPGGKRGSSAT